MVQFYLGGGGGAGAPLAPPPHQYASAKNYLIDINNPSDCSLDTGKVKVKCEKVFCFFLYYSFAKECNFVKQQIFTNVWGGSIELYNNTYHIALWGIVTSVTPPLSLAYWWGGGVVTPPPVLWFISNLIPVIYKCCWNGIIVTNGTKAGP